MPTRSTEEAKAIFDPTLIQTHSECLHLMALIDYEVADMKAQIERKLFGAEINAELTDWLYTIHLAMTYRRAERHRIYMRDRELRNLAVHFNKPSKDSTEGIAKQERLKVEAMRNMEKSKAATAKARALEEEAITQRSFYRRFHTSARMLLDAATFDKVGTLAQASE